MITSFKELLQLVRETTPKRVALVAAEDPVLIQAATRAQQEGIARFILFGNNNKIEALIPPGITGFDVVDSRNPAADAIGYIHQNKADLLMKGKIQTGELLKAILARDSGLRRGELLNHIAVIESPHYHKLLFISDGGINLYLDEHVFKKMVENITHYLALLGIQSPRFGMMSLVETVSDKIPETVIARNVVKALSKTVLIEGPIAPDVALSREAAMKKGLNSEIAGETDVFLMPSTTAANHLVKGLSALGGCKVGGVVVGARVPVILLSRSDDAETKYRSILLGLV